MRIGQKFNQMTFAECIFYIDNHKKYTDFNTLGLYRSIIENEKLSLDEKLELREYAHQFFKKAFDFLQIKDPITFIKVTTIGQEITKGDEEKIWNDIKINQQQILKDKKIKHRNFGIYSKHFCGNEKCLWHGLMLRQDSALSYSKIHFSSDKHCYNLKLKSESQKKERKNINNMIAKELENE